MKITVELEEVEGLVFAVEALGKDHDAVYGRLLEAKQRGENPAEYIIRMCDFAARDTHFLTPARPPEYPDYGDFELYDRRKTD